jgi:hypothetical protein
MSCGHELFRDPQIRNAELLTVKADGTYSNHWVLNGECLRSKEQNQSVPKRKDEVAATTCIVS